MNNAIHHAVYFAQNNQKHFLATLQDFIKIPSISTLPENKPDVVKTAVMAANLLQKIGMHNVNVMPTVGNPVVYADWLGAGTAQPTILIYGHYDVQPIDPLELWHTGPFDPVVQGDYLLGRGSSDMKGQIVAVLAALQSILQQGPLPVNVKFLLEGEEEIGSPSLRQFMLANKETFSCDFSLNVDAGMISPTTPTLVYALRGLAFFELRLYGPDHDLHSGGFGGIVHNPAVALAEVLAQLHNANGTITVPGFYDSVRPLSDKERQALATLPVDNEYYLKQTGATELWGESDFTPTERLGARPTLEINGMLSGYIGAGTKTVLPSVAMAKISCRLVADQDPDDIHKKFRSYLASIIPSTVRWEMDYLGGYPACAADPFQPAAEALAKALETVWGVRPVYKREGGSIPVVSDIQQILGADSVLTGFGLPDDLIHSPNEHLHLPTWYRGIEALIHFFFNVAKE
jgi:acetylornithine deacetylase/succinyl-diaminopimelate desuccinylase-like protein